MIRIRALPAALLLGGWLLPLAPAFANASIPVLFGEMQGQDFILWTLLGTLLAAIIERPFVTRAGVARRALLHSIAANLVSMLLAPLGWGLLALQPDYGRWSDYNVALALTSIGGLVISIFSEYGYYRLISRRAEVKPRLRWVAIGNVVSLVVIVGAWIALHFL